jgi:transposase-like protein
LVGGQYECSTKKIRLRFKRNAVHLTKAQGRTVIEAADNLGISKDLLYKWRQEKH